MDILTVVVLAIVLILTCAFLLYKKLLSLATLILKVLFPLAIILILATLFLPQIYSTFVETNFSTTQVASNIKNLDQSINTLQDFKAKISSSIGSLLNIDNQEQSIVKSDLYSQTVIFLTNLLRLITLFASLLLLFVLVYIRYAFSGIFEITSLEKRIRKLEKELNELKKD